MKDGYLIVVDDGTSIEAIPDDAGCLNFDVDNIAFSIGSNQISITGPTSSVRSIAAKQIVEPTDSTITTKAIETAQGKNCITCEGKRYCAKNGCIKTPCGWLCG